MDRRGRVRRAAVQALRRREISRGLGPALLALPGVFGVFGDDLPTWARIVLAVSGLIGLATVYAADLAKDRYIERVKRRNDAAKTLQKLLTGFVAFAKEGDTHAEARANVMYWDEVDQGLRMSGYHTPGYTDQEKALLWQKTEGCVGRVWAEQKSMAYPGSSGERATVEKASERQWGMTEEQTYATAERVKAVVAVPIIDPRPAVGGDALGVVCVDWSTAVKNDTCERTMELLTLLQDAVGELLLQAGGPVPEEPATA